MKPKQKQVTFEVLDFNVRRNKSLDSFLRIFHSDSEMDKECVSILQKHEVSEEMLLRNKDTLKGHLLTMERSQKGEYYTPPIWVNEAIKYFDEHIEGWRDDFYVWDAAAGTGNLISNLGIAKERIFASTLEEDDTNLLKEQGYQAFQLDFLSGIDYDEDNLYFSDKLPEELLAVLRNNKKIIFFMNPPYKTGKSGETDVSNMMLQDGLGNAARELYYQFLYRVIQLIDTYKLTNVYVGVFGLVTYHVGVSLRSFSQYMNRSLDILGGMLMPSDEFLDTSTSVRWTIGFTLFKQGVRSSDVTVYDVKDINSVGVIATTCREEFSFGRTSLSAWVEPEDVLDYIGRQRSGNPPEVIPQLVDKYASNAVGCMVLTNRVGDSGQRTVNSTLPLTFGVNIPVTPENFIRCAAAFTAQHTLATTTGWSSFVKRFYAPDIDEADKTMVDLFDTWCANAVVYFLCSLKSKGVSLRKNQDKGIILNVTNTLFPFAFASVIDGLAEAGCSEVILEELKNSYLDDLRLGTNDVVLDILDTVETKLWSEATDLLEFLYDNVVTNVELRTDGNNMVWDSGFTQLRKTLSVELDTQYKNKVSVLRNKLAKSVDMFNFI